MIAAVPEFERSRCLRYRYRYSACRRCLDACGHDAIALGDGGVELDAGKCANCALCTAACRTAALVPANLLRVDLLKQAIRAPRFAIACTPSGAAADAVVPCLGAVDAAMLAYLAKRGIALELRGAHHCDACEHGARGAGMLAANAAGRDALEDACAGETWTPLVIADSGETGPMPDFRAGRRRLFRRLLGKGVDEVVKTVAGPCESSAARQAIRPGPWRVPEMRELLQIVCRRADRDACHLPRHEALAAATLRLARGCTNCEACVRACPTGALQVRESENQWRLLFFGDRCVGCGLCAEVCRPCVLTSAETVDATPGAEPIALNVLAKQRCRRCDRFFVSAAPAETCAVCADDEVAFESIFG
jgi:formate hydrogenlyase subunit 6/NADH:ubiquinone oxidoreductase subunit I